MTKFQDELKAAIYELLEAEKNDLRMSKTENEYMRISARKVLESLIARCVDSKPVGWTCPEGHHTEFVARRLDFDFSTGQSISSPYCHECKRYYDD